MKKKKNIVNICLTQQRRTRSAISTGDYKKRKSIPIKGAGSVYLYTLQQGVYAFLHDWRGSLLFARYLCFTEWRRH